MTVKWHASNGPSLFWHKVQKSLSDKTAKSVMRIAGISTGVITIYQTATYVFAYRKIMVSLIVKIFIL
jgi:hypothetical protein